MHSLRRSRVTNPPPPAGVKLFHTPRGKRSTDITEIGIEKDNSTSEQAGYRHVEFDLTEALFNLRKSLMNMPCR